MNLLSNNEKRNVLFYFQVHQPTRLGVKRFFDIGSESGLFNDALDNDIMQRVATSCYLPTNGLLLNLIRKYPQIKIAFSISGVTIEQFEKYAPEVLESFRALAETGSVEFWEKHIFTPWDA